MRKKAVANSCLLPRSCAQPYGSGGQDFLSTISSVIREHVSTIKCRPRLRIYLIVKSLQLGSTFKVAFTEQYSSTAQRGPENVPSRSSMPFKEAW